MRCIGILLISATAVSVAACSSRVERFDYNYGSSHPGYDGSYSRLGGPVPRDAAPGSGDGSVVRAVRVASGDTLSGIARRYGVSERALREANGLPPNTDRLRVGQLLALPPPQHR